MTSPNSGLRRTALVVLAVGATFGATACSAGQVSQTANQVAAVDGGQGSAGDIDLNNLQVVMPENDGAPPRVEFAASLSGFAVSESITMDGLEIGGQQVDLGDFPPIDRGCSVISTTEEAATTPAAAEAEDVCIDKITTTLPSTGDLTVARSAPATATFSNGDVIETLAGVVAPHTDADYTRPEPTDIPAEGH